MKLPIRLRSAAEKDVSHCALFLNSRNPPAAIKFLDAFDATLLILQRTPEIGGSCRFANPLLEGIRVWSVASFKNYLIYYRILSEEIEIVRVLHAARDLESIFGGKDS
ncbi:type II toxin-antitoxin system RelE/ParE family toxin [Bythopirellula goksoeyrii]|uniref:Plasmid stabilization system protein n=1 Tax=Bythopirellula goksoeyrii TaxID=1400387 RepID=A0A5B9Q9G1_9BACT|nr:Plasmid stabilization system protein [Bythopirellula goksoeyrii]